MKAEWAACLWLPPAHVCVCLSAGEWVLPPIPECQPGRCEAQPLHQRQLRPRFQCLAELLCCDRYNLIHAALGLKRMRAGAAVKDTYTEVVSSVSERNTAEQCLLCVFSFLKTPPFTPVTNLTPQSSYVKRYISMVYKSSVKFKEALAESKMPGSTLFSSFWRVLL